ncbi:hypothetical protein Tco_1514993 [Tanacetum coccineum]
MRSSKCVDFWRATCQDLSSSSFHDICSLDFQVPFLPFLSVVEESSEDELTLLRRLRRLSSESELGGLSLGERLCPSLAVDHRRSASLITDPDAPVIVVMSGPCSASSRLSTRYLFFPILPNTGGRRLSFLRLSFWWRGGDTSSSGPNLVVLRYEITRRQFSRDPFQCEVVKPYSGPLFRRGWGGGLSGIRPLAPFGDGGVNSRHAVDLHACDCGGCSGLSQGRVPSICEDQVIWSIGASRRPALEIGLEDWSLCFFRCRSRWVKFPCFVFLDFGSVLSVVVPRMAQLC